MRVYVRAGNIDDKTWITDEIREMAAEQDYFSSLYSEEHSPKVVEQLLTIGVSLVAENADKKKLGFILGTITPHLYNPDLKVLSHMQWWVHPDHRKGVVAHILFTSFTNMGHEHADIITLSLRDDVPIKSENLKRYGFERHDKCYFLFK